MDRKKDMIIRGGENIDCFEVTAHIEVVVDLAIEYDDVTPIF